MGSTGTDYVYSSPKNVEQPHRVEIPPPQPFFKSLNNSLKETFFPDDPLRQFKNQPKSRRFLLGLQYVFPIFEWAPRYSLGFFKSDLISGITIASLAIPQGISYAKLANLPPILGLYSSFIPPLIYAMMGSSRDLAVGTVAVASLLTASMIGKEVNAIENPTLYLHLAFTAAFFAGVLEVSLESSEFSKRITKAFRSRQDPNGISWGKVSDAIKATYWDEFNKYVTYEADLTERVKDEWKKRAPKRYANQMNKWKKKGKCPSYLDDEAWKNWEKLWADPKAQQLSITRARSRRGGVEAVPAKGTYTGGGISINETTRRLAERNNGKQPSQIQVLAYTHTKNHDGVTFVDQKSEYIYNRMHELREEMTQQNRQINATELYLQSLPPPKQGRRPYGSQFCCEGASTSTGSSSGEPSYGETVAMLRELQQQFNAMADEMKSLRTTLRTMGVRSPSDSPPQSPDPTADL